mmetsp:Transcript_33118/g.70591  ORF Transcript_33118/g.70591 Transcript_33118/m.70591 type:complete len:264 (-) Transcript_33118:691-1482(-)
MPWMGYGRRRSHRSSWRRVVLASRAARIESSPPASSVPPALLLLRASSAAADVSTPMADSWSDIFRSRRSSSARAASSLVSKLGASSMSCVGSASSFPLVVGIGLSEPSSSSASFIVSNPSDEELSRRLSAFKVTTSVASLVSKLGISPTVGSAASFPLAIEDSSPGPSSSSAVSSLSGKEPIWRLSAFGACDSVADSSIFLCISDMTSFKALASLFISSFLDRSRDISFSFSSTLDASSSFSRSARPSLSSLEFFSPSRRSC